MSLFCWKPTSLRINSNVLNNGLHVWPHYCSSPATLISCVEHSPALVFVLGWIPSWEAVPSFCMANALTSFKSLLKSQLLTEGFPNSHIQTFKSLPRLNKNSIPNKMLYFLTEIQHGKVWSIITTSNLKSQVSFFSNSQFCLPCIC